MMLLENSSLKLGLMRLPLSLQGDDQFMFSFFGGILYFAREPRCSASSLAQALKLTNQAAVNAARRLAFSSVSGKIGRKP